MGSDQRSFLMEAFLKSHSRFTVCPARITSATLTTHKVQLGQEAASWSMCLAVLYLYYWKPGKIDWSDTDNQTARIRSLHCMLLRDHTKDFRTTLVGKFVFRHKVCIKSALGCSCRSRAIRLLCYILNTEVLAHRSFRERTVLSMNKSVDITTYCSQIISMELITS